MAAATGGRKIDFLFHRDPMAADTGETLVRAIQNIVRLLTVVEDPQCPAIRVVASAAVGPEASTVLIVPFMTIDACFGGILVSGRKMAFFAWDYGMQANQWKARQVVIEEYLFTPRLLVVTVIALLSFLALVNVVIRMTAVAIGAEFLPVLFSRMAIAAQYLSVCPEQSELGIRVVIEGDFFPAGLNMTFGTIRPERPLV
jgi:hypothetical protein